MDDPTAELLRRADWALELDRAAAAIAGLIAAGASVAARGRSGATALLLVCRSSSAAALDVLVEAGADPAEVDERGWNALHFATASPGVRDDIRAVLLPERERIINRLLELGVDVEHRAAGDAGRTPLCNAAGHLPAALCGRLLDAGVDPELATTGPRPRRPLPRSPRRGRCRPRR